jgi:hypothetical protein
VPGFFKLTVNLLLHPVGGHAHEACLSIPGLDSFADLKLPFPPVLINLLQGELNALMIPSGAGRIERAYWGNCRRTSVNSAMVFAGPVFYRSAISKRHVMNMPQRRPPRLFNICSIFRKWVPATRRLPRRRFWHALVRDRIDPVGGSLSPNRGAFVDRLPIDAATNG